MGTVVVPFWVYLDVEIKVHATTERIRNFLACRRPDFLQAGAALAKDNCALGRALDKDLLVNLDRAVIAFAVFLGFHATGIGQFGVKLEIELLSRDLGSIHAVSGVRDLIFRKMPGPFRH